MIHSIASLNCKDIFYEYCNCKIPQLHILDPENLFTINSLGHIPEHICRRNVLWNYGESVETSGIFFPPVKTP